MQDLFEKLGIKEDKISRFSATNSYKELYSRFNEQEVASYLRRITQYGKKTDLVKLYYFIKDFLSLKRISKCYYDPFKAFNLTLSHVRVIKDAQVRRLEKILIFEDDAIILPNWDASLLNRTLAILEKQPWSLFYPGYGLINPETEKINMEKL